MIVIVTGGRDYRDAKAVFSALRKLAPSQIVHGDAVGADRLADAWAVLNDFEPGVNLFRMPADWKPGGRFDPTAGPKRNRAMADREPRADVCLAFPGGKGTANMREEAGKRGIRVMQWPYDFKDVDFEATRAELVGAPWA